MIRCITIDDSPLALDLLDSYIGKIPFLKCVARCHNAVEAAELIRKGAADLIFLDVEMPDITGIDLLKNLENRPPVIFTTAYPHFALEGFNLNAVDYLLKPFSFHRFDEACQKALHLHEMALNFRKNEAFVFVKSGYDVVKILLHKIRYIEASRDYIQIFEGDHKVLSLMNLKDFLEMLPPTEFVRVHRSYIVALDQITRVNTKSVSVGSKEIPIGEMFREQFFRILKEKRVIR